MADVVLPQLGESVLEGTILRWNKNVGDTVAVDDILFEVSTDKVDSEVPSDVAGVLVEVLAGEGETVTVGAVIARINTSSAVGESSGEESSDEKVSWVAENAKSVNVNENDSRREAMNFENAEEGGSTDSGSQYLVSPIVRRIAREAGVDLADVRGTGVGGRVTRADVEAHAKQGADGTGGKIVRYPETKPASTQPVVTRPAPAPAPAVATPAEGESFIPFSTIRRRTAEHMVASLATSPHAVTAVEVFYDNVEKTRRAHKSAFEQREGFSLTYLPFIARATVDALAEFPHLNASVTGDGITLHRHVSLSIAVDLNFEGLVAPVVRNAEELRLLGVARAINNLAVRARTKRLSPDDLAGGTFTLSNSGSYGTHMVLPIINQPQVGIISTDGVTRKPAVIVDESGGEAIGVRSVGVLAMSWDHRAFDGAYAAAFMARIKEILETRDWEVEL